MTASTDRKIVRVRRWNIIRSQIRHRGLFWWLLRRIQTRRRGAS